MYNGIKKQVTIYLHFHIHKYVNGHYQKCLTSLIIKNANVEAIIRWKYFTYQLSKNEKHVTRQENRHFFGTNFVEGQFGNRL